MTQRIFVAINLPPELKKALFAYQQRWQNLPFRFTKRESLHLTVLFIGEADNEEVGRVCQTTKEVAQNHSPFTLEFERICLAPPHRPPRMLWLVGKDSEQLAAIKDELEEKISCAVRNFKRENRHLSTHITLARLKLSGAKAVPLSQIDEPVSFVVPVTSIEVMASDLKQDGAEYTILDRAALG